MNTPISPSDYMLFFRGTDWQRRLSPEQFQKLVSDWAQWFEGLKLEGKCTGGHPLRPEGKLVSGRNGKIVTDGPFAESKEVLGGYFFLHVAHMEEAVEIAKQCLGLEHGCVVEVRPVAERCADRKPGARSAASEARSLMAHNSTRDTLHEIQGA